MGVPYNPMSCLGQTKSERNQLRVMDMDDVWMETPKGSTCAVWGEQDAEEPAALGQFDRAVAYAGLGRSGARRQNAHVVSRGDQAACFPFEDPDIGSRVSRCHMDDGPPTTRTAHVASSAVTDGPWLILQLARRVVVTQGLRLSMRPSGIVMWLRASDPVQRCGFGGRGVAVRILHVTQTPVASDARVLKELQTLSEIASVELLAFGGPADGPPPAGIDVAVEQFDVISARLGWLPRPIRYALSLLEMTARFSRASLKARPDIVHCHDTMALPTGVLTKVLGSARWVIYDAHELESSKAGQSRLLSRATLMIEKACWSSIDALISVSPSILDWYTRNMGGRDGQDKPALCLLNSPARLMSEESSASMSVHDVRQATGLAKEVPLLIYVGAFVPGRGIELLLEVFAKRKDAHLALIGYGSLEGEIQAAAGSVENIHCCSAVPPDAVVSFVESADGAFCLIEDVSLSDYYCLPNKLFEYAFAGIPIIASRLPEIERIVRKYGLGRTVDLTEESVNRALDDFFSDESHTDPSGLNALSWEAQGSNLRQFYSDLTGTRLAGDLSDRDARQIHPRQVSQ